MAKWLDRLEDAGRKAVEQAKPPRPAPKLERVVTTTRYADPENGDPGAARYGWFYVEDGHLQMTDELGNPKGAPVALDQGADPRSVAAALTKSQARGDAKNGFEPGPLRYPPGRYGC
jgi:hypothetical protein